MIITQTRTEHLIIPSEAKFVECYEVTVLGESTPVEYDKMIRQVTYKVSDSCILLNFSMVKVICPIKFTDKSYRFQFDGMKDWTYSTDILMPDRSYKKSYCSKDMIVESRSLDGYELVFINGTTKSVIIK